MRSKPTCGRYNEEYLERDNLPLEDQLPRIIERLVEGAEILKAWELDRQQEQERWRQEAARRAELQRLAKEEEERWLRLVAAAQTWRTNQTVAQFIAELEAMPHEAEYMIAGKSVHDWLDWARRRVVEQDPLATGPHALFGKLVAEIENT